MLSQCAILVGAGISLDAPANFPIASNIMNAILEGISPSVEIVNSLKSLKVRTEGTYAELEDIYHLTGDQIRFETLIDVVSEFDKELNILDAIFNYTTPNLNHYNLANLAIHGNYILTPNFDDLIERAIINLGKFLRTSHAVFLISLHGKTIFTPILTESSTSIVSVPV